MNRRDLTIPFIVIDDEILWVGTPSAESNFASSAKPPFYKCRIASKEIIDLLKSYLNLNENQFVKERSQSNFRSSYSFRKYVQSWDTCPQCQSIRRIEEQSDRTIRLVCDYCGMRVRVQSWYFQKYLEYADVRCQHCNRPFEINETENQIVVECRGCSQMFDIFTFI